MASTSRLTLSSCLGCLRASTQPVASSSRSVIVAPFSTTASSSYSAPTPEDATARKPPHTASAESLDASNASSPTIVGGGRKSAGRGRPKMLPPFPEWMAGDGRHYKQPKPGSGPSWIGETPFPLNPAFNPPPPLRHAVKTDIWKLHTSDPVKWTIPALSQKFNIGKERMAAVLRLKALETEWTSQAKPLQTEFQSNMDRLLGAKTKGVDEPAPAVQSSDASTRGPQHEEFADSASPNARSVIAPAMTKLSAKRRSMIASLPSGGPAAGKVQPRSVKNAPSPTAATSRPSLLITNVPASSYEGAGRVERNLKRAAKRAKSRKATVANAKAAKSTRSNAAKKNSLKTVAGTVKKPKAVRA
ncbi:uncharacterized protein PFL1_05000 [Pseudozyma flocculosa PF-1]|uniref:Required for respiratory growth protein 9, mitochondrial n=2 Tax=Pseudozyma flocculosa TaxID=84751 RepID=A0A5C3EYB7_9BASI|nr:uncharacterized protein PFL1_05000 [Pseudozyma flocculosa PF-1]EPQ27462.1 hypothetical protein PFL1_05000 [Pseudozyma flocculosa PF-1]SPO36109.1 uncharacterized protein PSFLO_01580 [Pseudozyma flocculosa]